MSDPVQVLLTQVGELKGQLQSMTQMIQHNHEATHQRINDFRHAMEGRMAGIEARVERAEERVEKVEEKERSNSIKSAGGGAFAGAIATASIELIKFFSSR